MGYQSGPKGVKTLAISFFLLGSAFASMHSEALATDKKGHIWQQVIHAEACKIAIGSQTQAWMDALVGRMTEAERAEEVEWFYLLRKPEPDFEECSKFRAELYRDGWLE